MHNENTSKVRGFDHKDNKNKEHELRLYITIYHFYYNANVITRYELTGSNSL